MGIETSRLHMLLWCQQSEKHEWFNILMGILEFKTRHSIIGEALLENC